MRTVPSLLGHPGLVVGVVCGVAGAALQGEEAGVLWFFVGCFAGKSLQSIYWTVTGTHPS
ncbi:hypothetical protein SAMN05216559_3730 [Halomicrobium zhouii]|uniref:Uncharacterized protein n=1 Tax=Halomicrobium zhouii TaxID=767519 RepID=A0A1I6M420_9EURY|nr:hypothetical protein [Halomicrobium zhouii]SFS10436.1 hypothetical protein SAMN05216559_3730 [Halomicrobium zhouii]